MLVQTLEAPASATAIPAAASGRDADIFIIEYAVRERAPAVRRQSSPVLRWVACVVAGITGAALLVGALLMADTSCPVGSFDQLGCQTAPVSSVPAPNLSSFVVEQGVVITPEIVPPLVSVTGSAQ
jgi:hypothetical protein